MRRFIAVAVALVLASAITVPAAAKAPMESVYRAECVVAGTVNVTAVFFADPNPVGGSTSAFHVVGDNRVFIVFTGGTDRNADDLCHFVWTGGRMPGADPWGGNMLEFWTLVFVTPKSDRSLGPETNLALGRPTSASATWSNPGFDSSKAVDGDPYSYWSSGSFPEQWIEIDLGRNYAVTSVAAWVTMLPDGYTRHSIWVRSETGRWTEPTKVWTFEGFTQDLQRLTASTASRAGGMAIWAPVRYVRVLSEASPSWIGWREIEVYGYAAR
jgi:hypothetical protein